MLKNVHPAVGMKVKLIRGDVDPRSEWPICEKGLPRLNTCHWGAGDVPVGSIGEIYKHVLRPELKPENPSRYMLALKFPGIEPAPGRCFGLGQNLDPEAFEIVEMPNETEVMNDDGYRFRVVRVRKGDKYGLKNCLTHKEDEPLVEFYDLQFPDKFGPEGQFVSRYNWNTLMARRGGLCLDGGVPVWTVDDNAMECVYDWMERLGAK